MCGQILVEKSGANPWRTLVNHFGRSAMLKSDRADRGSSFSTGHLGLEVVPEGL
jgi:hypothetical protein